MNRYWTIYGIVSEFQSMILREFLRKREDGPLNEQIFIVSHIDAFMNECKCSETRYAHTLESILGENSLHSDERES